MRKGHGSTERDLTPPSPTGVTLFTDEQERRFRIRHDEGFNVFTDDDNVSWLEIHHPESLPHPTPKDFTLAGNFSYVSPAVQIAINSSLPESPVTENSPSSSRQPPVTENTPSTSRQPPVTENTPSTSRQRPVTENTPSTSRQPPVTEKSPSTSRQSPVTENTPSTSRQPPVTENTPSTSRQPPVTENTPSTSRQPPVTENTPSTSRQRPVTENSPSTSRQPPVTENGVSVTGGMGRIAATTCKRLASILSSLIPTHWDSSAAACLLRFFVLQFLPSGVQYHRLDV